MNRTVTYHITEADANMQILNFLRSKGFSRHILSSMKAGKSRRTYLIKKSGCSENPGSGNRLHRTYYSGSHEPFCFI